MRSTLLLTVLALVGWLAVLALAQDAAAPTTIVWRTDLEAARADAAKSGRPLMVVFR